MFNAVNYKMILDPFDPIVLNMFKTIGMLGSIVLFFPRNK